ncbi:extracellular solute-binding protein [Streptomyces sp. NBC_01387]|uniref:ABC transporter substrate-binding protein n=1 Tax=unclassified Streptomyces TaxID=2593676 RepID=UPI00202438CB|nr:MULTISPECIES: extracellular solute-binding protein [unclassified Streptomyces]MCX4553619.1 extracellular solute-binding protein [Streptomyces sp. NBC_01500]WSV52609.1 extracellular solute-binding protein [Streptomyces sp. NBC_01014]
MPRTTSARRTVVLCAALALLTAGCTAGGGAGQASDGSKTMTFLTFETPNLDAAYWDAAIARASKAVPGVKIKKLVAPSADRNTYVKQLAASGQLPDIMISVSPDGLAQSGKLAAWPAATLDDYVSPQSNPIGGKIYQLPYNTQPTPLVYYNKTLFRAAGITAAPTTYKDFLADCAALKKKGVNPLVVGGGGKDTWADGFPLIAAVGTDVYAKDPHWLAERRAGKRKFTDATFTSALNKVEKLAGSGYIDRSGLSRDYASTEQAFRDGKGAMYPMGSWFAASADSKKPPFDVGVFAWPGDNGADTVPAYTGGGISVSSSAPDVKLAQKWSAAFMLDKQNLDASVRSDGSLIAVKGYTPPTTMGPVYKATVKIYQDAARRGSVVNAFSVETGDTGLVPGLSDKLWAGTAELIAGRTSAGALARRLDGEWAKDAG